MKYGDQVETLGSNRHQLARLQVINAVAVCAGEAVLDRELFHAAPHSRTDAAVEVDGNMTAIKDTIGAFAIGFYAQSYGPASEHARTKEGVPIMNTLFGWNRGVSDATRAKASPAAFRRIFFEGGLWHVFINPYDDEQGTLRSMLEAAPDYREIKKHKKLQAIAEAVRPNFARLAPLSFSHEGSHSDAARFANTVLRIGEEEFGMKQDDEKAAFLEKSLPELKRPATHFDLEGVNAAISELCIDPKTLRFKDEFITIDDRPHVGFNIEAIAERIQEVMPDVASHNHRGCPAIYQKTPYKGENTPIFTVMNKTLLRLYCESGALSRPGLRPVPSKSKLHIFGV